MNFIRLLAPISLLFGTTVGAQVATVDLHPGLTITKSVRIARKVYTLRAHPSMDSSVIVIRGSNITVDFNGAELRGASLDALPDEAAGVAIRIDGGRNVKIINARVRGYRVGIRATGTRGLTLANNDVSYNWKPRLFSLVEHESLVDWMSFHHNENREWLRFGAGVYLEDVVGGEVSGNTAEQGINGLMMTRVDSLRIHDNTFAYNSGLGIGMYRSSHNTIYRNVVDFNVRGFSDGFFKRGQDSAGLLMFEQSSHNVVAWNSITHGGDGLFLWAGQTTMDTGEGGSNDNLYYQNDFSYAPTNGIEATFSRNDFLGNRVQGSEHGLWGGYSFDSRIIGNCFADNRYGIAIEHGQDITIADNMFNADSIALRLWGDSIAPSDWGYPKKRDTRSRDYRIRNNVVASYSFPPLRVANTTIADSSDNLQGWPGGPDKCAFQRRLTPEVVKTVVSRLPQSDAREIPVSPTSVMLRDAIVIDEWGPFDWRSPKLWPVDSVRAPTVRMRVLGPPGAWRLVQSKGVTRVSSERGRIGDTITVTPMPDANATNGWSIVLEYVGEATMDSRGVKRGKGAPVTFGYELFAPAIAWDTKFYAWADSTDPRTHAAAFAQLIVGPPLMIRQESRLDYFWSRPGISGVPREKFAVVATGRVNVPAGAHTLRTISDDAVRVWIDGKLAIDNWKPHESAVDNVIITQGPHDLRVEYVQVDGWVELRVEVVRGVQRSVGSAGPH